MLMAVNFENVCGQFRLFNTIMAETHVSKKSSKNLCSLKCELKSIDVVSIFDTRNFKALFRFRAPVSICCSHAIFFWEIWK